MAEHKRQPKEEPTADNFVPEYRQHVYTQTPAGKTPVSPVYCLMNHSANDLAHILQDLHPAIDQCDPYKSVPGGGVSVSAEVPWFKFPSGCMVNAGIEASYWLNAPDGATAEKNCRADIAAAEKQYQIEGGDQQ